MTGVRMHLQNPFSLLMALLNKSKNWNSFAKIWNTLITLVHSLRTSFEYKLILILGFAKFEFWLGKNNIGTLVHVWIIFYFPIGTGPVQLLLIEAYLKLHVWFRSELDISLMYWVTILLPTNCNSNLAKFKIGTNLNLCMCIFVILLHKMWLVYLRVASLLTIAFLLVGSLILHEHYF